MMLGGIVIWYRSSGPLRNSAPQPYFSTRTTPRVLPTAKPRAAILSIAFESKRCSMFHIVFKTRECGHVCKEAPEAVHLCRFIFRRANCIQLGVNWSDIR